LYDCSRHHDKVDSLYPLHRTRQPWTAQTVRFTRNYTHPRRGPTEALSIAYYPTDVRNDVPATVPFTGPVVDIGSATLCAVALLLLGTVILSTTGSRRT
jgi:hypothetical protein